MLSPEEILKKIKGVFITKNKLTARQVIDKSY